MNILLQPFKKEDLEKIVEWRNDPKVNKYLANRNKTLPEVIEWFEKSFKKQNDLIFGIFISNQLIGYCEIESIDKNHKKCEMGIIIGEQNYWGKGIAEYIIKKLLKIVFEDLKLHRCLAVIDKGNIASSKCFRAAGFKYEGKLRDATIVDEKYCDLLLYSVLEDEYNKMILK
ncbi:MAG TPA: N-acetyltransferase [Candidatus Cloacimonetes bacterium]|nr:N-acetyltransferase [Candidatus Cloacimonadota bacterium]